jgi:hypothetical protein
MGVIRGTSIVATPSTNSLVVPFPAGCQVGDQAILFAGHPNALTAPAGWSNLQNTFGGANWAGQTCQKTLTAGDIAAGSATVTAGGGAGDGVAAMLVINSANAGTVRETDAARNGTGSNAVQITTSANVLSTDFSIYFGSNGANSLDTVSRGTQYQQATAGSGHTASGCLYAELPAPKGATTVTFNYPTAGFGNYEVIVVVQITNPPAPGLDCAVSTSGTTVSTYISDLGLNIAPATELYQNFILPSQIAVSESNSEGRTAIVMDFNQGDGLYSRDIETAFTWAVGSRLALRVWQPSLIKMPEQVFGRPSDWDDGGTPGAKYIQGIIVEADSFNLPKTFQLQSSDDLSINALNEVPATFPKQTTKSFSCVTPFVAHSVRIVATDAVAWRVWKSNLVFEPWPEQTTNWQTEQTSLGLMGWGHIREMNVAYASANPLTVVLTFDSWPTITFTLPSSGGALVQAKTKVTIAPNKFKLVSFRIFSTAPFYLFEQDLEVKCKQWGSTGPYNVLKVIGGPSKPGANV